MQKKAMKSNGIIEICDQLKLARRIAVFCHARPDGDTLGAAIALCLVLGKSGKYAVVFCADTVPEKYNFLPHIRDVQENFPENATFDTLVSVDCSEPSRMGMLSAVFSEFKGRKVNIDHHVSNKFFAGYNLVRECPATCEIMAELLVSAGYEIDREIAELLMLGLITDSGNFTHNDVTDKTFETAALLRKKGANVSNINYQMFTRQSKFKALLFGKVMQNLRFALDDRLAFAIIRRDYFDNGVVDGSITEGFVDFPLSIDGVEVSISLLEVKKHQFKVSLRSKGRVNVNAVAAVFGGGGHVLASGCMLCGELEEIIDKITYAVYQNI